MAKKNKKKEQSKLNAALKKICGVFLVMFVVALYVSLASYNPADSCFNQQNDTPPANLLGVFGANLADVVLCSFGVSFPFFALAFLFWGYALSPYKVLELIVNENIDILVKETYLQQKEIDELRKLILTLGKSDIESQARMIQLSIENLKKLTDETESDINKKGMVYKKLSTIMGLIVGIILI